MSSRPVRDRSGEGHTGDPDFRKRARLFLKLGVKTACVLSAGHCWNSEDSSGSAREGPWTLSNLHTVKHGGVLVTARR